MPIIVGNELFEKKFLDPIDILNDFLFSDEDIDLFSFMKKRYSELDGRDFLNVYLAVFVLGNNLFQLNEEHSVLIGEHRCVVVNRYSYKDRQVL